MQSSSTISSSTPLSNKYLHPRKFSRILEEQEEQMDTDQTKACDSPDYNYSLKGDAFEDRKYYIYKVRDVNMVPKKECVGKVIVPERGNSSVVDEITTVGGNASRTRQGKITLEELRQLIRHSSDEMLQEAAKQRFRYLSESYHLVAVDESYTPVDQIYPTQGVFIKLDNEHPFSKPSVDKSLTARLQAEYERRFGPIVPRWHKNSSYKNKPTKWDILSQGGKIDNDNSFNKSRSIFNDPVPFNADVIKDQFEKQKQFKPHFGKYRERKQTNFRYDSFDQDKNGRFKDTSMIRDKDGRKISFGETSDFRSRKYSMNTNDYNRHHHYPYQQRQRHPKGQSKDIIIMLTKYKNLVGHVSGQINQFLLKNPKFFSLSLNYYLN